jgi:hypothetical protein
VLDSRLLNHLAGWQAPLASGCGRATRRRPSSGAEGGRRRGVLGIDADQASGAGADHAEGPRDARRLEGDDGRGLVQRVLRGGERLLRAV